MSHQVEWAVQPCPLLSNLTWTRGLTAEQGRPPAQAGCTSCGVSYKRLAITRRFQMDCEW